MVDENDGFFDENGVGADPRSRPKCASSYHDHRIAAPVNEDDSDEEAASRSRGAGLQTLSQSDRALGCRSLRDFVDEVRKHLYRITRVKTVFEEQNPLGSLIVPDPANQNRSSLYVVACCGYPSLQVPCASAVQCYVFYLRTHQHPKQQDANRTAINVVSRRPKFYSYLVCLDQAHVPRFLPTMLARVTPPRTFMVNQNSGRYNNLLSEEQQLGSSGSHGSKSSSSSDRSSTRPGGGAPTASGAPGLQSNIEADPSREPSSTSHTSSSVNPEGAGQGRGPVGPRIASSIRPDFSQACYELMRYVHAVEFCDGHDFDYRQDPRAIDAADIALRAGPPTGAVSSASSRVTASKQALTASLDEAQLRNERKFGIHAASPTFLLETRKGDVRDHALLLCNLFLGLNLDAYVVIGKVYRDNRLLENATEHVWVMTRENSNACCGGSNTNTRAQSTSTGQINDAAVRFWEVTNNQIYDLESRCMSVASSGGGTITGEDRGSSQTGRGNGVDSGRSTHGNGAINSHNDDSFRGVDGRGGVSASDFEIETKTSIPDQESSRGSGGVDRDVLRLLDAEEAADRTAERRAAKDQLFFTTSGLGDGKNCMSQDDVLRENKVLEQLARNDFSIKEQEDRSRLNSSIQLSANYQDQIRAIRATTAVLPYVTCRARRMLLSLGLLYIRLQIVFAHCAGRYAEVYAVFNNRNLWVNMQWREENNVNVMNRDPARITYNMGLPGTENEWLPFVTAERGGGSIVPCYIPRSLSARLPQDQVREMEERALEELVSGLENVRSVVNATTVLANESSPGMVKSVACLVHTIFDGFAKGAPTYKFAGLWCLIAAGGHRMSLRQNLSWTTGGLTTTPTQGVNGQGGARLGLSKSIADLSHSIVGRFSSSVANPGPVFTARLIFTVAQSPRYLKAVTKLMEQRPANYAMRMQLTKMNSADAVRVRQMIFGDGMEKEQYSTGGRATGVDPTSSVFTVDEYNDIAPFTFPDEWGGGGGSAGDDAGRYAASLGGVERVPISLHGTMKAREWDPFHVRTGREMFVVAAKVFPLFNGLVMTYAAILCVYPNTAATGTEASARVDSASVADSGSLGRAVDGGGERQRDDDLGGNLRAALSEHGAI